MLQSKTKITKFRKNHSMVYREIPDLGSQMHIVAELGLYRPQDSQQDDGFILTATKSQYVESVVFIWLILVILTVYLTDKEYSRWW